MDTNTFSDRTTAWLGGWLSGGEEITSITSEIIQELTPYHPTKTVILFRGTQKGDQIKNNQITFDFYSSWTYDPSIAQQFGDQVIYAHFNPDDILVDITLLDWNFLVRRCSAFPEEQEVIVNPGTYEFHLEHQE